MDIIISQILNNIACQKVIELFDLFFGVMKNLNFVFKNALTTATVVDTSKDE